MRRTTPADRGWATETLGVWSPNPALLWAAYVDPDPVTELSGQAPSARVAGPLEAVVVALDAVRAGTLTQSRDAVDDAALIDAPTASEHLGRWVGGLQATDAGPGADLGPVPLRPDTGR